MKNFSESITLPAPVALTPARCSDGHGTLSALFFSDDFFDIVRAKAICQKCTDRDQCLNGALEREEPWGVWGGELLEGGRIVLGLRPRGRPSTRDTGPLVVQEVPIPAHLVA